MPIHHTGPTAVACLCLVATLSISRVATAQISFGGCYDAAHRAVPNVPKPDLNDIAVATLAPDGTPIIQYNPQVVARTGQTAARFFYLHECAHHALGTVIRVAGGMERLSVYAEQAADCSAITYLVKSKEFGKDEVEEVQASLSQSPGDATHYYGPVRASNIPKCLTKAGLSIEEDAEDPPTYTARFRIWSRYEGNPTTLDVAVDEEEAGSLSNTTKTGTLAVEDLKAGKHTLLLSNITVYGADGAVIASGLECSTTFRLTATKTFALAARLQQDGSVVCSAR